MEYTVSPPKYSLIRTTGDFFIEIIKIVVISLAIIIPVRYYLIQPFYVKGASMETSYIDGDYLLIDELTFKLLKKQPTRGEVVVFRPPTHRKDYFIKRIIGLPFETIEIKDGAVWVYNNNFPEGAILDESLYLRSGVLTTVAQGAQKITLQDNEYFVLGDNRTQSMDSRSFGPIQYESIVGRTWVRGFPFGRIETLAPPIYNFE